jgi:hypothetical protein
MTHNLKIKMEYFWAVLNGLKTFEIRYNDRNFKVFDYVYLNEVDDKFDFTGRSIKVKIIYITDFEQKDGYVVFGFKIQE